MALLLLFFYIFTFRRPHPIYIKNMLAGRTLCTDLIVRLINLHNDWVVFWYTKPFDHICDRCFLVIQSIKTYTPKCNSFLPKWYFQSMAYKFSTFEILFTKNLTLIQTVSFVTNLKIKAGLYWKKYSHLKNEPKLNIYFYLLHK